MEELQKCTRCAAEKPLSGFYRDERRSNHRQPCKACINDGRRIGPRKVKKERQEPETIICRRCLTDLPTVQFHRRKTSKRGFDSICRNCRKKHLNGEFPDRLPRLQTDSTALFWERVKKTLTCWRWTGTIDHRGGGTFSYGGRTNPKYVVAHRYSYELHIGPIPPKTQVCHHDNCEYPDCVNPEHLFLSTHQITMRRMVEGGKSASGINAPTYRKLQKKWTRRPIKDVKSPNPWKKKLVTAQIQAIRSLFATGEYTAKDIAAMFDISPTTAWEIVTYRTWKHI